MRTNPYPFPNDLDELGRLDDIQYLIEATYGDTIIAPLARKTHALVFDAGTGSGSWVLETADRYPDAYVIGMDISPVQPTDVYHNCEFRYGDLTKSLEDFDTNTFDLVHSRYLPFQGAWDDVDSFTLGLGTISGILTLQNYTACVNVGDTSKQWKPTLQNGMREM
jgi:SAM-dependent methyltransferase